ncbi:Kinase [Hexamita inflata]|uniref:Kinase n=1 Tax=Hexamita inflata TaxID=28002 RepID=A0AA86U3F4_9EUKA|nr:Kinase [Hexamita inflata]
MDRVTFKQIRAATACIQYQGYRPLQQWEAEYNQLTQIEEKNKASINMCREFAMINRCNSTVSFPFAQFLSNDAHLFTGFESTTFDTEKANNLTNRLQMNYKEENDWEKINSALFQLVQEISGKDQMFKAKGADYKRDLQLVVDNFEDIYADCTGQPLTDLEKFQEKNAQFKKDIDQKVREFYQQCKELFPKSRFSKFNDITREAIDLNFDNFKEYVKDYGYISYLRARQKTVKKAKKLIERETKNEDEFINNGEEGVMISTQNLVEMSYQDYTGKFQDFEVSEDILEFFEDLEEHEEPEKEIDTEQFSEIFSEVSDEVVEEYSEQEFVGEGGEYFEAENESFDGFDDFSDESEPDPVKPVPFMPTGDKLDEKAQQELIIDQRDITEAPEKATKKTKIMSETLSIPNVVKEIPYQIPEFQLMVMQMQELEKVEQLHLEKEEKRKRVHHFKEDKPSQIDNINADQIDQRTPQIEHEPMLTVQFQEAVPEPYIPKNKKMCITYMGQTVEKDPVQLAKDLEEKRKRDEEVKRLVEEKLAEEKAKAEAEKKAAEAKKLEDKKQLEAAKKAAKVKADAQLAAKKKTDDAKKTVSKKKVEDSESSEEDLKPKKKVVKPVKKVVEDSDSESVEVKKKPVAAKKTVTAKPKAKVQESTSDDSEEVQKKPAPVVKQEIKQPEIKQPEVKKVVKKVESSEESEEDPKKIAAAIKAKKEAMALAAQQKAEADKKAAEQEKEIKAPTPVKEVEKPKQVVKDTKKKQEESSSEEPVTKKPVAKKVVKKEESTSSEEEKKPVKKPVAKPAAKKVVKKEETSDSSSDKKPVPKKTPQKKIVDSDDSSEEVKPKPKKAVTKKVAESSDDSSDDKPKKPVKKATTIAAKKTIAAPVVKKEVKPAEPVKVEKPKPEETSSTQTYSYSDSDTKEEVKPVVPVAPVKPEVKAPVKPEAKTKVVAKKPAKAESSDSSEEVVPKKVVKKAVTKSTAKKDESSSSDIPKPKVRAAPKKEVPKRKVESDESSEEKVAKPKVMPKPKIPADTKKKVEESFSDDKPKKKAKKIESSDSEEDDKQKMKVKTEISSDSEDAPKKKKIVRVDKKKAVAVKRIEESEPEQDEKFNVNVTDDSDDGKRKKAKKVAKKIESSDSDSDPDELKPKRIREHKESSEERSESELQDKPKQIKILEAVKTTGEENAEEPKQEESSSELIIKEVKPTMTRTTDLNDVEFEQVDMTKVQNTDQQFIFGDEELDNDEFKVLKNKRQVAFALTPDAVLHQFRAAAVAQQSVIARMARKQQLEIYNNILTDTYTMICCHFPESAQIENRFIILPTKKQKSSWETLLNGYDLRTHQYVSMKQLPANLCGLQFVRTFRALAHPNILSFQGLGFSLYNQLYVATQAAPVLTLAEILTKGIPIFETEVIVKNFIKQLTETIAFLNNPVNKLMHRDLKPSTIYVQIVDGQPVPKVYHIGFMQGADGNEQPECGGLWCSPEVACGGVVLASDVWSIGSICYRLLEDIAVQNIRNNEASVLNLANQVGVKGTAMLKARRKLFIEGSFQSDAAVPNKVLPLQEANNAAAVGAMVAVAKDTIPIAKDKPTKIAITKEANLPTFSKDARVKQLRAYEVAGGKLPWERENRGQEKDTRLVDLKLFGISEEAVDYVQSCWVFDCQKRPKANAILQHKWFQ